MGCCLSKSDGRLYTQDAQMLELTGSARKQAASDVSDGVLSGVTEVGAALGTAGAGTAQRHGPRSAYYADQDPTLVALKRGIVKFNFQAKQGIEYLSRVGLLPAPGTPGAAPAVASFFYTGGAIPQETALTPLTTPSPAAAAAASTAAAGQGLPPLKRVSEPLSKRSIGEYLGTAGKDEDSRRWHREVLEAYCQLFTFTGMELVPALRTFLSAFHLPGEAQVIDRLMTRFAETYHRDNPPTPAPAPGVAVPAGAQQARLETVNASPRLASAGSTGGMDPSATVALLPLSPSLPRSMRTAAKGTAAGTRTGGKAGAGTAAVPAPIAGAPPPAPAAAGRGSGRWSPFLTPDTPYILAFGAIMLNTDLHKASQVAHTHAKPMTRAQFVRNMMGVVSPPSSSSSSSAPSANGVPGGGAGATGASGSGAPASPAPPTNPYIGPSICPDTGCLLSPLETAERVFVSVYEDIAATPLALETTADSAHGAAAGGAGKMGAKRGSFAQHDSYYNEYANVTFFAPAKQGWLSKKGSHGLRTWKRRWFLLTDGCLYYFPSPAAVASAQPRCILPLDNAEVLSAGSNGLRIIPQEGADTVRSSTSVSSAGAPRQAAVVLKSAKRLSSGAIIRGQHSEFILRAASKSERDAWLAALCAHAVRAPMQKLRRQSTVRARGALLSVARLPTLTSTDLEDKAAGLVGVGGGSRLSLLRDSAAVPQASVAGEGAEGEMGHATEEGGPDADTPCLLPQTHSQHSSQGRATIGSSGAGSDVRRSVSGTARATGHTLSMAFKHEAAVVEGNSSGTVLVDLAAPSGFSQPASASSAAEGPVGRGAHQLAEEEEGVANLLHPASSDTTTIADTMSALDPHSPLVSGLPSPSAHLQLLHLTREALRVHETPASAPAAATAVSSIRAPQLGTAAASLRTPSMGSERSAPTSPLPSSHSAGVAAVGAGGRPATAAATAHTRPAPAADLPHPYSAQGFTAHSMSGGGSEKGDRESGSLPFETASDVSSVDGTEAAHGGSAEDFHFDEEEEEEEGQGLPTAESPLDGHGSGGHFHAPHRSPLHSPQWGGQLLDDQDEDVDGVEAQQHGHARHQQQQLQQQQQGERGRGREQRGRRRSLRGLSSEDEEYDGGGEDRAGEKSALQAPAAQPQTLSQSHHNPYGGTTGASSGTGNSTIGAGLSARLQTVGAGVRSLASAVLKPSPSAMTGSGAGGEKGLSHAHHRSLTGTLLGGGGGQSAIPVPSYSSSHSSSASANSGSAPGRPYGSVHAHGEGADAEPSVSNTSFGGKSGLGHRLGPALQGVVEGVGGGLRDGLGLLLGGSAAAAGFSRTLRSDSDAEALEGDRVLPPSSAASASVVSAGPLPNVSSLSLSAAAGGLPTPLPPPKQRVIVHPSATGASSGSVSGGGGVSNRVKLAGPGLSRAPATPATPTAAGGAPPMKPLPPPIPHSPQTSASRTGSAPSPSLGPLHLSVGSHHKQSLPNPASQGLGQGQLPSVLSGTDVLAHTSSSTAAPAHASGAAAMAASSGLPPAGPHTAHAHHMRSLTSVSTISSGTAGTTGVEGGKVSGHSRKTRSLADQVDSAVD